MAKDQADAKQQPVAELLLFENYSHSSSTLLAKINRTYYNHTNKKIKRTSVYGYTVNHNENEDKNEK